MNNTVSTEDMKKSALEFIGQLARGDFSGATTKFDDTLRSQMPRDRLEAMWQQLTSQAGAIMKINGVSTADVQGFKVVIVSIRFAKMTLDMQAPFNDQGQMGGLGFQPGSAAASQYRPPAYVDQKAFHEVEVTVGSGEWALPGTLSMPEGNGPFPGVVLVHGSGPNDRDESIGPNKVFRDIAWGLASRGIAVVRYDKRTYAHRGKFTPELADRVTVKEEIVDDALLAAHLLRHTPKVDPRRVFVLGHSEGGMLIPWIGRQGPGLAGLIIMAGSPRPLEDSILDQITYIYGLSGAMSEQQKAELEALKVQVARVKRREFDEHTPKKDLPLGMPPVYLLSLRDYRPIEVAKTLTMPILIFQGERDYQIIAAKDFEAWKEALGKRPNVMFKLFPKLNHLLIEGEGLSKPEEYAIEGHVSEEVIDTVASWIKAVR
jgi:dienelactone hydrolase